MMQEEYPMMTLDEAIKHALQKAVECKGTECGYDHYQLAKWLAELRFYRNLAIDFKLFLNLSELNRNNFTEEENELINKEYRN